MKSKREIIYGLTVFFLLFAGVFVAKTAGIWQVSGKVNPDGSLVMLSGEDVEEIKGWSTLGEVIESYSLNKDQIYDAFNLSSDVTLDTELKELAEMTEEVLSPSSMKDFITTHQSNEASTEKPEVSEELEQKLFEIKGDSAIEEVINTFQLDQKEFYKNFGLKSSLSVQTKLKEIAQMTEGKVSPIIVKDYIRDQE